MGCKTIHRHHIRLGLQDKKSPSINAKLRHKIAQKSDHTLKKPQHQPHPSAPIHYGTKKKYAAQQLTAPLIDMKSKKFIQQVCRKFLFLGREVDSTLLFPTSAIASRSSSPTEYTKKKTQHLLDYMATQEEADLTYNTSNMKLVAYSNARLLSETKARSRAGGHLF